MKKLTAKTQAAWDAIRTSGATTFPYVNAGGLGLPDGTKIHSHTVSALVQRGLLTERTWWQDGNGKQSPDGDGLDRFAGRFSFHGEFTIAAR